MQNVGFLMTRFNCILLNPLNVVFFTATQLHKYVNVEVDPTGRSERPEWATARYHAHYSPQCGFELQVQWMVSTGGILGDLVSCY